MGHYALCFLGTNIFAIKFCHYFQVSLEERSYS